MGENEIHMHIVISFFLDFFQDKCFSKHLSNTRGVSNRSLLGFTGLAVF